MPCSMFPQVEVMIVSLFCTQENGILIQDSFPLNDEYNCLLGIEVPYHYFVRKVGLIHTGYPETSNLNENNQCR